jgi:hypothetical protein
VCAPSDYALMWLTTLGAGVACFTGTQVLAILVPKYCVCAPSDYALMWPTTLGARYYLFYWYKGTHTDAEKALGLVVGNLALAASCVGCVLAYRQPGLRARISASSCVLAYRQAASAASCVGCVLAYRVRARTKVASSSTSLQPHLPASLHVSAFIAP